MNWTALTQPLKREKNRAEIRAADFSLEFRLKTSLQKMCLSAKLSNACLNTCEVKFYGHKFASN